MFDILKYFQATEDSLSATICNCDATNDVGAKACKKLGENLEQRLNFVKTKLEENSNLGRCPCEQELINVRVEVDPIKSPNTKNVALDVFQNMYTSATLFMEKQGMNLTNFSSESQFVIPEETCYRGDINGGEYKLKEGNGAASISFRLEVFSFIMKSLRSLVSDS